MTTAFISENRNVWKHTHIYTAIVELYQVSEIDLLCEGRLDFQRNNMKIDCGNRQLNRIDKITLPVAAAAAAH